jgi:hypothetical protein
VHREQNEKPSAKGKRKSSSSKRGERRSKRRKTREREKFKESKGVKQVWKHVAQRGGKEVNEDHTNEMRDQWTPNRATSDDSERNWRTGHG